MSEKYRVLGLMTAAQAGASVMQQSVGVLAPFLIAEYALSKAALGALFTSMFVGSTCFTALGGALTDRIGERRMVLISGGLMSVALFAAALRSEYAWLVGWMAVFGAGYAGATPAGGRAILSWFDRDRGVAMGIRQTGVPIGGLIGALMLPFAALHFGGYRAGFFVAAALVALPTLLTGVLYHESAVDRPSAGGMRAIGRGMRELAFDPRLIAVTITCMVLVNVQLSLNGFLTLTAIGIGFSQQAASFAFAAAFASATVARLFWGWLSDRWFRDRAVLLGVLCFFAAFATLGVAFVRPATAALLVPLAVALGFTGAGWNGLMAAALAEIGGPARAGSALGLTLTAIFGTSTVGPLVFGTIADRHGLAAAWLVTACVTLVGVLPAIWLRARTPRTRTA